MKEKTDKLVTLVCLGLAVLATVFAVVFALDIDNNAFFYGITYWMLLILLGVSIIAIVVFLCKKLADRFKTQPSWFDFKKNHDYIWSWKDPVPFFTYTIEHVLTYRADMKKREH